MPPSKEQSWEERFDKEFGTPPNDNAFLMEDFITKDKMCVTCGHPANPSKALEDVKSFIKQTLREQLQSLLAEMPEEWNSDGYTESQSHRGFYEKGHDEVVNKVKEILTTRLSSLDSTV